VRSGRHLRDSDNRRVKGACVRYGSACAVTMSVEFPQKTIASVAPSITPPEKLGGVVGGSWPVALAAGVVTTHCSLMSDQFRAESRALTLKV
jgi:hypothetical protein